MRDGKVTQIVLKNDDGTGKETLFDSENTHPYNELDIDEDATGKPTAVQMKFDGQPNTTADFSAVGQVLGSALGRALAPNNQFVQLAAGTVVGAIGQKLAQAFAASLTTNGAGVNLASVFADFNVSIASAGASSVASFLVAELGTALHLDGFGGQLFNAAAGGFTGSVASQIASQMAATPGLTFDAAIAGVNFGNAAVSAAYGVSALFGSFLGHELVPAQTHEGAVGGQLLGAVGSAIGISAALSGALGTVLGFIAPGIGSLIGTILGTLIGDAFGSVPHPAATDLIDQAGYLYGSTHYQTSASDGGSYSTPDQMVVPALAIINAYLSAVKGAALDHSKQVTIGYQANPVFYIDGVPGHPAIGTFLYPNAAVQAAALDVLQNTEVIGGDLMMKRAHQNSSSSHAPPPLPVDPNSNGDPGPTGSAVQVSAAEQLAVMSGDLGVAQDYENYLNNREAINALMAANPNSAFTAGWIATFARVSELGLNHVNASDFTGGLVGYLDSVGKAGLGSWASSVSVSYGGADNSVITIAIKTPNGVEVPGALAAFADATTVSSDASGQTVQLIIGANLAAVGFHRRDAGITTGDGYNDIWFGDGSGQTFNGSGGHDILVGGSGNDTIHGGPGWDFIDGGAGNDTLFGDDGNDILRGGAGNDVLDGGAGTDTAVFGGKVGSYTLVSYNGIIGVLTHGADGSDRLQGIENLQFTDTGIAPGAVAVFDALAYIASYPDLITAFGVNPQSGFDHYVGGGFAEGRSISFDPFQYIASNPDLITAIGLDAVVAEQHYIVSGYYEHRPAHSFDAFEYIASNPDLIATFGLNPLAGEKHYITNGYFEHRPATSFDAVEYLASNTDLITAFGLNPMAAEQHYIAGGFNEHRPTHSFDAVEYLASNPDLIAAFGLNPMAAEQHYVASGFNQHRATTSFDAVEYIASNPDLITALGFNALAGEQHYVASGFNEHRATTSFDAAQYLANYPDLAAALGNNFVAAEQHYVVSGFYEGRTDKAPNHAPVLTVPATSITANAHQSLQVSSWFSAIDADNDALTYYFADSSPAANSGQFVLNGTPIAANTSFGVTAAQLATLTFVAGADGVADNLSIQLSDGHAVSAGLALSVHVNHAPVLTVPATSITANAGQSLQVSSWFSATDADNDALTYVFADSSPAANSGQFVLNGTPIAANTSFGVSAAQLATLTFVAGADGVADNLSMQLSDGRAVSEGIPFSVHVNHAPVLTVAASNITAHAHQSLQVSSWFSASDADNDALTYVFADSSPAANSGHFMLNGTPMPDNVSFGVTAAQLSQLTFVAGAAASSDALSMALWDGHAASAIGQFNVHAAAPTPSDFNGDARSDLLLLNDTTGGLYVCEMNGAAMGENALSFTIAATSGWHYQGLGDFDGDHKSDVLLLNYTSAGVYVCEMNGTRLGTNAQAFLIDSPSGWHFQDLGDFNGDGKSDVLLMNSITNGIYVCEMNGTELATNGLSFNVAAADGWHYQGLGDFNGDGKSDVLLLNSITNGVYVCEMNGTELAGNGLSLNVDAAGGWHFQGLADFNGDGKSDLLLLNDLTHGVYVCEMDGSQMAANGLAGTLASGWHFADTGDFNGDGKADLLLLNDSTRGVMVWQMDGTQVQAAVQAGTALAGYHYLGKGDYNGDGKTDLVFQNDATGAEQLWQMNGTAILENSQMAQLAAGWHLAI
jgi:hypothetical protein